jgi:Putative peptidoglycan binding domain
MRRLPAILEAALALVLVVVAAPLAGAHAIDGQVWSDSHSLCVTCTVNRGRVVGWWQTILWADDFLAECGSAGIDGVFGTTTKGATKSWQANYNLSADGVVGPNTWSKAKSFVVHDSGALYHYLGYSHGPKLDYDSNLNVWYFLPPASSSYWLTDHPSTTFGKC